MSTPRFLKWLLILGLTLGIIFVGYYFFRTHLTIDSRYKKEEVLNTEEWKMSFGQEVIVTYASISPAVLGEWYVTQGIFGSYELKFVPQHNFSKGEIYTVDVMLARTYDRTKNIEFSNLKFSVAPAPGIVSLSIDKGSKKILPNPRIDVVLGDELAGQELIPSIEGQDISFTRILHEGNHFVWTTANDLPQGIPLALQLKDKQGTVIVTRDFETVVEPAIVSLQAKEPLLPGTKIIALFNVPMMASSSPLLFDVSGEGTWTSPVSYEYTVRSVTANKNYTVTLPVGTPSLDGGKVEHEDVRMFSSPGPIVAAFSNISHEYDIHTPIVISFDQPVVHKSAEKAFSINPAVKGALSWKNDRLIFTPSKFENQKKYTATLGAGVSAQFGLPSNIKSALSFYTIPEVIKLAVPYFQQEYSRSCEAASLRMTLAYRGIQTNDMDILQKIGYAPREKDLINDIWDDPHVMFVGNASKDEGSGYGVYAEPVALAAKKFGREAAYTTTVTPQFIAKNIHAGNPVILWGYTSLEVPQTIWKTPTGGEALALNGEHARVVVGVYGSETNPIGFYIHDPKNGRQYEYWDTQSLVKNFSAVSGVTNQAVAVN